MGHGVGQSCSTLAETFMLTQNAAHVLSPSLAASRRPLSSRPINPGILLGRSTQPLLNSVWAFFLPVFQHFALSSRESGKQLLFRESSQPRDGPRIRTRCQYTKVRAPLAGRKSKVKTGKPVKTSHLTGFTFLETLRCTDVLALLGKQSSRRRGSQTSFQ